MRAAPLPWLCGRQCLPVSDCHRDDTCATDARNTLFVAAEAGKLSSVLVSWL